MNTNKYIAGDWVKLIGVCPPRNGQIERVSEYFLLFKEGFYIVDFREIQPIPLTFKILEENGWELREHHERKHFEDVEWYLYHNPAVTHVSLRFYPEKEVFFPFLYKEEISEKPIQYVHQLQHLLFGLGIDFDFNLGNRKKGGEK